MSTTAIQGNPIEIDLTQLALSSGWSVDGSVASHESCNDGNLYLLNYPLEIGKSYHYTYQVDTRSSGYVQAFLGTNHGAMVSATGFVDETVVANGTQFYFYSNGTLSIEIFDISVVFALTSPYNENTIAYSALQDKWVSFYSYIPDDAFSLYTRIYSFYQGGAYVHAEGSSSRGNFYGVQYPAIIVFTTNQQPTISKTYLSLNYQANELLITAPSGVVTSYGQVSELISDDFVQADYGGGVVVYDVENLYQANFMRDIQTGIVNGSQLKGNWCKLTMVTASASGVLNLFSTEILYNHSYTGIR